MFCLFADKMRVYVRKGQRGNASREQLQIAVRAVIEGGQSVRSAASEYGINYKTLGRYVKVKKTNGDFGEVGWKNNNTVMKKQLEDLLVDYVKKASSIYHGLTPCDVRSLAYNLSIANGVKVPENWTRDHMAGLDWFQNLMHRYPALAIRQPEATSLARMNSFNRANVNMFYDNLSDVLKRGSGYGPEAIWNIDETGVTTVQKPRKVVSERGVKQVGATVSQERGVLVTLCCGINAIGNSMPPFFVFPRVNVQSFWMEAAPPGSIANGHPKASGWMTSENFVEFLKHFRGHAKPSEQKPVLLILDNHQSHISIEAIDYAKEHNITMLSFPPHCSHALQPLDKSVFGPFKKYLNTAMDNWMREPRNANKSMTVHILPSMVAYAFPKAFTPSNIQSGFKSTGIYPYDRCLFSEADFMPSYVSDRPLLPVEQGTSDEVLVSGNVPGASIVQSLTENTNAQVLPALPEDVRPLPKAPPRDASQRRRKIRKSAIYTDTPEKNRLLAESSRRPTTTSTAVAVGSSKVARKRKLNVDVAEENHDENEETQLCDDDSDDDMPLAQIARGVRRSLDQASTITAHDNCVICGEYGRDNEWWYRCTICAFWVHAACSDASSADDYVCDYCRLK